MDIHSTSRFTVETNETCFFDRHGIMIAIELLASLNELVEAASCCLVFFILCLLCFSYVLRMMNGSGRVVCPDCQHKNRSGGVCCSQCGSYLNVSEAKVKTEKDRYFARKLIAWKQQGRLPEKTFQALVRLHREDIGLVQAAPKSAEKTADSEVMPQTTAGESAVGRTPPAMPQEPKIIPPKPGDDAAGGSLGEERRKTSPSAEAPVIRTRQTVQPAAARKVPVAATSVSTVKADPEMVSGGAMKRPRKLSDILKTFMDESNIKIGEFISGLLIVVGSIGLVVTLNVQFQDQVPYLPAAVFMTVVALFHVAGLYSLRKWNLEASSKAILYIASLLIPLNMLAATIRDTLPDSAGWLFYLAVLLGAGGFGTMSYLSSRALAPDRWWPLMLAVIGPSAMQTVVKLLSAAGMADGVVAVNAIILVPVAFVAVAVLAEHRVVRTARRVTTRDAMSLLRVLTLGIFSLGACVVVLFLKSDDLESWLELARQLANPFLMLSFVVVSSGMLLHRRLEGEDQVRYRLVGTWMAITGCMGVVGSFALAIPNLDSMLLVSVLGTILSLVFGRLSRITFLAASGTVGLGLASWCVLVKATVDVGEILSIRSLWHFWCDGYSALLFTVVAVVAAGVHLLIRRNASEENDEFAKCGFLGAGILAANGLLVSVYCAVLKQQEVATDATLAVFAIYALAALVAAAYVARKEVIMVAAALVPVTWMQAVNTSTLARWDSLDLMGKFGVCAFATVVTYVLSLVGYWSAAQRNLGILRRQERQFCQVFMTGASFVAYLVAAIFTVGYVYSWEGFYQEAFVRSTVLSVVMLIIALHYLTDWTWLFVQLQVMLSVAMAITLGWTLQHVGLGLDESSHLRAQLIGLSLGMMGWTLVRKVCQQSPQLAKIVITDMMYADFVIQVIATAVMYVVWHTSMLPPLVGAYGTESVLAGMAVELGHHVNRWDWVLWSLALVAWLSVIPDRHRRTSSMCALIVFSALPILATAQLVESMEHQVEAFPHFLRWGYSLFGIVTAMVVCTDFFWWKRLVARLPRLMDNKEGPERANRGAQTWRLLRIFSLLVATLPVLLLTLLQYVHVIGIYVQGMGGRFEIMSGGVSFFESYPRLAFAGPLWLLMVTYWIHAARTRAVHYLWLSFPFWQCGWMFVGLLSTWMDAEAAHFGDLVHGFNWWLLGQALYGFAWAGLEWRGTQRRGNNTEGAVAKPLELFVGRSASVGFAALSFVLLVVYGAIGVIDGFVLHGGVAMDNWEGEASAFANVEAFLAVLSVIGSLVLWSTVKGYRWQDACTLRPSGKAAVWLSPLSLILLTLLSLVPLVAHLGLSRMSPNADLFRAVSQVLVRQTMGFVLLLGVICTAVVLLLPRWYAASKASSGEMAEGSSSPWKLLDKRLAGVLGVSDLLAILVASSCGMLLLAGTQNDWFVIGLLAFTSLIFVVMAGALQEVRSVGWAILLSLATVALVDFQLANTVPHLANMETKLIEQHLADCWRTEVASLSAIAMLLGLSVSLFRSRTPTVRIPGTVSPSVTWLVGGSVGLLAVGSVWAVVAGLSEDVPSWVGTSREIGNLLVPLVALVLLGRQADFNGWSRLFYTWTVALAAALLAMGMVNPIEPYAVQLNGARILYGVTAFLAAWGMVALQSDRFCEFLSLLGIKDAGRRFEESRLELFWVQASTGGVVLTASFLATFVLPEALMLHRYLVALLPCGLVLGLQIARGTEHENESVGGAVVMVCFSILGILWADLGPGYAIDVWLSRWVRLFIGSSILAVIVSNTVSGLVARWPNHQRLGQWLQMASISVAALSLLCVLGIELVNRSLGGALSTLEVLAVCGGLVFVGWSLLVMAMNPSRDVLALSDTGRQVYVYLSEVIVLLLLGHLWLTRPDWFTIFQNSWPYVLFALAFVGAFVSEYLRRSGIKVLSDPIHNTSFLLPAVPIIGLVLFRDSMVGPAAEYQWYFLLAALVNVVMAFFRKSFLHAMLAALAGNGSLWSAFIGADFAFVDHPQFWLVPPAVSVLIAGQLNRDRLQKHELSFLRYVTISLIYLASSSEMVIKWSVELADIQALATLAGLSLLGVVVGMLYRIRQFVYLGLGFFLLAMGGSIAKVTTYNQLWFWVSLVGLGAVMLVVFAARERYQPILRKKLAEMESWDQEAESGE